MSHYVIRQLFEQKLLQWATTNNVKVSYENTVFTPTVLESDQAYVKSFLKPVDTRSRTLSGDHTGYMGVYQVTIVIALDAGVGLANQLAESLKLVYPIYKPIVSGSFKVIPITPLQVMDGIIGDAAYSLPVFFRYRADTN